MTQIPWRCAGCGKESVKTERVCDCPTASLYRIPVGGGPSESTVKDSSDLRIVGVASRIRLTHQMTNYPHTCELIISAPPPARHPHLTPLTDLAQSAARKQLEQSEREDIGQEIASRRTSGLQQLVNALRPPVEDSGFLLSDGTFATRQEARAIAIANGQVQPDQKLHPTMLFSEDLW